MRLLKINDDGSFSPESFHEDKVPPFAILSHTWSTEPNDEIKLHDIIDGTYANKPAFQKLLFCSKKARYDGLQYFWIDTCSIDQKNHVELSDAINSMFQWFQRAAKCYVYLSDVSRYIQDGKPYSGWEAAFYKSRWFTRGWTLQELLAPKIVEFFSHDGVLLGDKRSLERQIAEITSIPPGAIQGNELSNFSIDERFSWAQGRQTTKAEDKAYCLLGIFSIFLPLIYGEGQISAIRRLRKEIRDCRTIDPPTDTHRPSYSIPFPRNQRFIGRNTILEELERKLLIDMDTQLVALVGLGGSGKTQIVLEFAYTVKECWPEYSIFWIPGLSMETLEQACSEIARTLKINQATDDEDVKELVKQYLSSNVAGKWLLVVDNADDVDLLFGGAQQSHGIIDYLPQSDNGLTLFTTRYQEVAAKLAGSDMIELEEMNDQEAVIFLEKSLAPNSVARKKIQDDKVNVNKLLDELQYLPLAIAQAAAYLKQDFIRLLGHETQYRNKNTENAVAKTWLVSFNEIRKHDEVAIDLLCFISCIESKAIPLSILPSVQPEERMVQAIGTLCGYSFITHRGSQEMYDTHRLVHFAAGKWIQENSSSAEVIERAIQHVSTVFPTAEFENQAIYREYLTHALRLLASKGGRDIGARYILCLKVGQCLYKEGRIKESVRWIKESCEWRAVNLAEDNPDRLASQHELAIAYRADGQTKKAVELLEHVVNIRTRLLSEEHPSRLASQHALAEAYQEDGQITEAVELLEHVVSVNTRVMAEEHPHRLVSQHTLAGAYQANGQITKAVELLEYVVSVNTRVLDEVHPSRLASQHTLAGAYQADGQTWKAVELLEHVVNIRTRLLFEEHSSRLASQYALAEAYQADGQITKAVELLEHVVSVNTRVLAEEHPHRLVSQHTLAGAYQANGQITKAVELLEHIIHVRSRVFAEDHPYRLKSQLQMASAYQADGQILKAIELLEHVVNVNTRVLAEDLPDRLASQHVLASAYQADGQTTKAIKLLEHVVNVRNRLISEEHPSRLASQYALAEAYQADGQITKAVELLEHVVSVNTRVLAEEHPHRLVSQHTLAGAYQANGQITKAVELLEHVVRVESQVLAVDHPNRLASQHKLAMVYQTDGQITKAVELLEHVVRVESQFLSDDHPNRLVSQHALAGAYRSQGRWREAEKLEVQVMTTSLRVRGAEHPSTLTSMANLAATYKNQGRWKEAEKLELQVLEMRERVLGVEHPDTLVSKEILALTRQEIELVHPVLSESNLRDRNYANSDRDSDVSDVSSVWSTTSSKYSESSTHSALDITQKVPEHLAEAIYNDSDLRALFEEGALKYEKTRLLKNTDKLFKKLFKNLRKIANSESQLATIRILRGNRQRAIVNDIVYATVNPSSAGERNIMERLRLQKADREFTLNRLLFSSSRTTPGTDKDSTTEVIDTCKVQVAEDPDDVASDSSDSNNSFDEGQPSYEASGSRTVPDNELGSLRSLKSVMKFLMTTEPFVQFRADLRQFIYPPTTLAAALDASNTKLIRRMIVNDFEVYANGEFSWLQDLKDTGFNSHEIADILIEERTDAPWIRYKLPEPPTFETKPGKHLNQCAHALCRKNTHISRLLIEQKNFPDSTRSSNMERTVQGFCGLAGIRPCSDNKATWGGTVHFNQLLNMAVISYASQDDSITADRLTAVRRTINALDQFLFATSAIQAANQCCDSFTVLVHRTAADTQSQLGVVELYRLEFQRAISLSKHLKRLLESPAPTPLELECAYTSATNIIDILFPAGGLLSEMKTFNSVVHVCAIAVQFLCVGLLSYSQAHISPLQPFFLDHNLTEIQLTGSEESESLTISVCLLHLSCIGEMLNNPVIVFIGSKSPLKGDFSAQYDILASTEDILDTFGPGKLVFLTPGTAQPCAVSIRGGLITANEGDSEVFHWGRDQQLHQSLKRFDPTRKILIGAPWKVNISCTFDEESCRKRVTLEPLGTVSDSWELKEHQAGLQGGLYVIGTYNSTYCKIAGTTLKDRMLGKADDMLLLDLEDIWGVQVSACTAVACRVPLRTLLADVLPIFAQADGLTKLDWETLERSHDIVAKLKLPNFIDFVGQLDERVQKYLVAKIRGTLEILRHTGVSKNQKYFSVAWPHGRDVQRGIRIVCEKESYWTRMLADTSDCATFAYMSSQCLESRHCRCSGKPIWQNTAKILITAVSLHQRFETTLSATSGTPPRSSWTLSHEERYIIGTSDIFLKVEVHKPSTSAYALLRPTVLKIPSKYGKRIIEKIAERASSVARLRERQNPEDNAENVLVTCYV